jgi:hypothetical protein
MLPQLDRNATETSDAEVSSWNTPTVVRTLALTALLGASAVHEAIHVTAILAPGVWVHLRTGLWILQNHAVPHTGLFSQDSNVHWSDASWSFDVLLGLIYRAFGLRALPLLLMLLKVGLAASTFLLALTGRADFWMALVLSAAAQYATSGLQPLPYVFSILFFAVELSLLVRSRQTGSTDLYRLPWLFLFWANVDIQFVFGLGLLLIYLIACGIGELIRKSAKSSISDRMEGIDLRRAGIAGLLSLLATFATPYTIHLLPNGFSSLYSQAAFEYFSEMSAMSFRHPPEFVLMLLVMAGFLSLGRRRSLDLFSLLTLVAGTAIAFRVQRDGWLAVLPAIAIIPQGFLQRRPLLKMTKRQGMSAAALTAATIVCAVLSLPRNHDLMNKIDQVYPVRACDYIRNNSLPQPLFNAYSWGSFLTWYLPQYPVAVDSRVELYGDHWFRSYFDVVSGRQRLEAASRVSPTGALLLERQSAMAKALTNLPLLEAKYKLVYSDDLASVFVGRAAGQ